MASKGMTFKRENSCRLYPQTSGFKTVWHYINEHRTKMKKFNHRFIIIHCISTLLNFIAFQALPVIFNLTYLPFANQRYPQVNLNFAIEHKLYILDMYHYMTLVTLLLLLGLILSFIQSILVCRKLHLHWLNAVAAILLAIVVYIGGRLFQPGQISYYFNFKNSYFDIVSKTFPFLISSLLLVYSQKIRTFIKTAK